MTRFIKAIALSGALVLGGVLVAPAAGAEELAAAYDATNVGYNAEMDTATLDEASTGLSVNFEASSVGYNPELDESTAASGE